MRVAGEKRGAGWVTLLLITIKTRSPCGRAATKFLRRLSRFDQRSVTSTVVMSSSEHAILLGRHLKARQFYEVQSFSPPEAYWRPWRHVADCVCHPDAVAVARNRSRPRENSEPVAG